MLQQWPLLFNVILGWSESSCGSYRGSQWVWESYSVVKKVSSTQPLMYQQKLWMRTFSLRRSFLNLKITMLPLEWHSFICTMYAYNHRTHAALLIFNVFHIAILVLCSLVLAFIPFKSQGTTCTVSRFRWI